VDGLREVLSRVPKRIEVHRVDLEQVTVEEQMERIRSVLRDSGPVSFASLFAGAWSRAEVVTTFIALLELIRLGAARAIQKRTFGEILIEPGK
jgi:segregation and condensation protein A